MTGMHRITFKHVAIMMQYAYGIAGDKIGFATDIKRLSRCQSQNINNATMLQEAISILLKPDDDIAVAVDISIENHNLTLNRSLI